jgi:hypothetical protein
VLVLDEDRSLDGLKLAKKVASGLDLQVERIARCATVRATSLPYFSCPILRLNQSVLTSLALRGRPAVASSRLPVDPYKLR